MSTVNTNKIRPMLLRLKVFKRHPLPKFRKSSLLLPSIQEVEKLLSRLSARPHATQHTARHGRSCRLFYSPHYHAQMT